MHEMLRHFLASETSNARAITNERALQLELGLMFRQHGCDVQFEVPCAVSCDLRHTRRQKRDLDLLVRDGDSRLAIELKVPLAGRVPETMFDFYADIAFVEAAVGFGIADRGLCILATSDRNFWSGRLASGIYEPFRTPGRRLHGEVQKPTGGRDTTVYVAGEYQLSWSNVANHNLLPGGRYVMVEVAGNLPH